MKLSPPNITSNRKILGSFTVSPVPMNSILLYPLHNQLCTDVWHEDCGCTVLCIFGSSHAQSPSSVLLGHYRKQLRLASTKEDLRAFKHYKLLCLLCCSHGYIHKESI